MVTVPSPPYVPALYHGGPQDRIDRIVLHSAVMPLYEGAAVDLANYFQHPDAYVSAHYTLDTTLRRQCVWDNTVAWHDGYNWRELGLEMCEIPSADITRWDGAEHQALLRNTASIVGDLCRYYELPMVRLGVADVEAGARGICGHDVISRSSLSASGHTDPGAFPWGDFLNLVRGEDEMSYQDAYQAITDVIWHELHQSRVQGSEVALPLGSALMNVDARSYVTQTEDLPAVRAQLAGLSQAVEALSQDSTLTAERVEAIVRDAVQQQIAITGTVRVTGQEGGTA